MLTELYVRNFAIIDELHLEFGAGLNVLTGETGAGKSIIVDAVSLLLGGRALSEWVRAGEDRAEVEGYFHLPERVTAQLAPRLEEHGLESEEGGALILAREVRREGRNICRVNGRAVALNVLAEIAQGLVDLHGQSEHLSLLRVREHVNLLDRFADLMPLREQMATTVQSLRRVRAELERLQRDARELARRIDLLSFQVEEIEGAALSPDEEQELEAERRRLANAEQLATQAAAISALLEEGTGEGATALDLLSQVEARLERLARIDPDLEPMHNQVQVILEQMSDVAREVSLYGESVEFNPRRLAEVEERLALVFNLKRKYGDSIEEILAFGQQARQELAELENAEVRTEELRAEEERLLREIGHIGAELSERRQNVAEALVRSVEAELADLRMEGARFAVGINQVEDENGAFLPDGRRVAFGATGLDRVEFLVSANPGEPLRPLVRVASGGETSRLMLALKTVLSQADDTPTLIFDEIDQGIGGRVGTVVGQKLWGLTAGERGHQVLCITHLPQLAAYADRHVRVVKALDGERTITRVEHVESDTRTRELASMLGTAGEKGLASAQELLMHVDAAKQNQKNLVTTTA